MKYVWWGVGIVSAFTVFKFFQEQLVTRPIRPDPADVAWSSATGDNSAYATEEAQAFGPFQPGVPAIPHTPYAWTQFVEQGNAGIIPPGSGIPKYAY